MCVKSSKKGHAFQLLQLADCQGTGGYSNSWFTGVIFELALWEVNIAMDNHHFIGKSM